MYAYGQTYIQISLPLPPQWSPPLWPGRGGMYVLMSGVYGICGIDAEIQVCLCTCLLVTVWGIIHMENIYTIRVRYIEPLDRARAVYI